MHRRQFLRCAISAGGGAALLPAVGMAAVLPARAGTAPGGPYGELGRRPPDENGLVLPDGFTSRVVGVAGETVEGTDLQWHVYPDGAATFDDGEGGWWLVSNSEVPIPGMGGASSLHFDADGQIVGGSRVLDGTQTNCAGGPTPWGTWLSCEEVPLIGQVWECDPSGEEEAVVRPALGSFRHEAVAVDPDDGRLYLTEDEVDGLLYRFTPEGTTDDGRLDLDAGGLEAAVVDGAGAVSWVAVPDPSGASAPTRTQVPEARRFDGGEGIWFHDGAVVFTTKGDGYVRTLDVADQRLTPIHQGQEPLTGVDNVTVEAGSGDVYVAEDGGNMEVVLLTPEGEVVPFVRVRSEGWQDSEVTGPVFDPSGERLYFSSQRAVGPRSVREILGEGPSVPQAGATYEVTGPFRGAAASSPTTTTLEGASGSSSGDDDGPDPALLLGIGGAAVVAGAAGTIWWRRRGAGATEG